MFPIQPWEDISIPLFSFHLDGYTIKMIQIIIWTNLQMYIVASHLFVKILFTACKYTCHKKCCARIAVTCCGQPQAKVTGRIIGASLADLVSDEVKIPLIFERLISLIEINGLYTEGIYRRPGSEAKVKDLKHRLNTENGEWMNKIVYFSKNFIFKSLKILFAFGRYCVESCTSWILCNYMKNKQIILRVSFFVNKRASVLSID